MSTPDVEAQLINAYAEGRKDERAEWAPVLAALEEARTGLLWYIDRNPDQADGSDDEVMERIEAAIAGVTP